MMHVLIGIPAFNEEEHIGEVIDKAKNHGWVYVVNDGSVDKTNKVAKEHNATVYSFKRNKGYGSAIAHLFKEAKFNDVDVLITLDGDGQHNPDEIPRFIQAIEDGVDMAIGNRFMGETDIPRYRKLGVNLLSSLTYVGDSQCGFRAYNKKAINEIRLKKKDFGVSLEILEQAKAKHLSIVEVACSVKYEGTEHSQHPITHGISLMDTLFWGTVWERPILILGIPSAVCFSSGIIFTLMLMVEYTTTHHFPLNLAILALGGLLMGVLLGISTLFVLIGKRLLRELKP